MSDPTPVDPPAPVSLDDDHAHKVDGAKPTVRAAARAALAGDIAFLALTAPTAPETLAQVKALTRQAAVLIRLVAGDDLLTGNDS